MLLKWKTVIFIIEDGEYLANGLSSDTFGQSEVNGLGLSATGFKGNKGSGDTTAVTS